MPWSYSVQDIECRKEFQKWWMGLLEQAEDNAMKDSSQKSLFDLNNISSARARTKNKEETQLTKWWNNLIRPKTKQNGKRCHRQTGMNHDIPNVSQVPQQSKPIQDRYKDDLTLVLLYKRTNDENRSSDELDSSSSNENNSCDNPSPTQSHSSPSDSIKNRKTCPSVV